MCLCALFLDGCFACTYLHILVAVVLLLSHVRLGRVGTVLCRPLGGFVALNQVCYGQGGRFVVLSKLCSMHAMDIQECKLLHPLRSFT